MRERVLIVEDNKTLAKLIAKKMETALNMDIVVAYSLADAERAIEDNDDFFITLLDLNLPDAPNGEVVDMVLSKGLLAVVLTGTFDEATRQAYMQKPIVDYVVKSKLDNINYIFRMIDRLRKNRDYKVLVVEPHRPTRDGAAAILKSQLFRVIVAAHGEEAMSYLADNPDISLVLTADEMPALGGFELMENIRESSDKNSVGVLLMTDGKKEHITAKFIKNGANDYLKKPFNKEELITRVEGVVEAMEAAKKLDHIAKTDDVSQLFTPAHFTGLLTEACEHTKTPHSMAIISIDDFELINAKYGCEAANLVIGEVGRAMHAHFGSSVMGRLLGGEMAVVLPFSFDEALKKFVQFRSDAANRQVAAGDKAVKISISMGASEVKSSATETLNACYGALLKAKMGGKNRIEIDDN